MVCMTIQPPYDLKLQRLNCLYHIVRFVNTFHILRKFSLFMYNSNNQQKMSKIP